MLYFTIITRKDLSIERNSTNDVIFEKIPSKYLMHCSIIKEYLKHYKQHLLNDDEENKTDDDDENKMNVSTLFDNNEEDEVIEYYFDNVQSDNFNYILKYVKRYHENPVKLIDYYDESFDAKNCRNNVSDAGYIDDLPQLTDPDMNGDVKVLFYRLVDLLACVDFFGVTLMDEILSMYIAFATLKNKPLLKIVDDFHLTEEDIIKMKALYPHKIDPAELNGKDPSELETEESRNAELMTS